jgi:hypothetical protein
MVVVVVMAVVMVVLVVVPVVARGCGARARGLVVEWSGDDDGGDGCHGGGGGACGARGLVPVGRKLSLFNRIFKKN